MLTDDTLVTRSRTRERAKGEHRQKQEMQIVGSTSLGLRLPASSFLQLGEQEAGSPGTNKELLPLLSNLKGSSRSRSRGGNGDWLSVRRSPRKNLSPSEVKKVAFKTRTTVLSLGGTEKEVGA